MFLAALFLQSDHLVFLEEIAKQGPVVAGLMLAIFYFYKRQMKLEADLKAANEKMEKYITEDRENLSEIIENNTAAFRDFHRIMESIKREPAKTV